MYSMLSYLSVLDWGSSVGSVKALTLDIYFSIILGNLVHFVLAWDCLGTHLDITGIYR